MPGPYIPVSLFMELLLQALQKDLVCTAHVCFLLFSKYYSITDVSIWRPLNKRVCKNYTNTVPMRT